MGFGSYDESEQQNREINTDESDNEGENVHKNDHGGEVKFETDASTDDLVAKLAEIKGNNDDEE